MSVEVVTLIVMSLLAVTIVVVLWREHRKYGWFHRLPRPILSPRDYDESHREQEHTERAGEVFDPVAWLDQRTDERVTDRIRHTHLRDQRAAGATPEQLRREPREPH